MHSTLRAPVPALREAHPFLAFVHRFQSIHTVIGIIGNALFLTGSLTFMLGPQRLALYLFIAGSAGMLLGSVGSAVVMRYEAHQRRRRDH
jgi:energy-converting hydrogenase Eha subunit G